ncbi:hypothetical protein Rvan_1460 [Rhodomicrobium vannielii ATCC 17100]|uniref:RloB domain-containing protein n=1 Tax=Rhodomicrobium vannielii (strain ATCC 17100 / DSM 162 / LMG 4299 / NCIMB 10020 / ATH 3.1.1) TaxID=648757 RepID=E3I764_RHOVT|nr:RloB family protein [Rhodomicrobium vannielii]ADP70715.1 hypothetical protein Rvan_1460 [Rhodomicrobium vannielii ATCC 17100]
MARDNHPRERQARALARKKGTRPPYDRILIVTEGSKTEPIYFEDIRQQNRVPSAHIRIVPGEGTAPIQIVDTAWDLFLKEKAFEWVFAVFDRDEHRTYHEALRRAAALDQSRKNDEGKSIRFIAIPSVPCFELWLLLHFRDVHDFWHRHALIRELRSDLPGYEKGMEGVYERTEPSLAQAVARAQRLKARFSPENGRDPYTSVDEVVSLLRSIRAAR